MIHRKVFRADLASTIVAHALLQLRAPPVGVAQLPGLLALALYVRGVGVQVEPVAHQDKLPITALMRRTPADELCSFCILKDPSSLVFSTCGPQQISFEMSPIV